MWDDWSNWAICVWGSQRHPQGPCGCWGAVTQRPPPWLRVYSNGFMAGFLIPGNLVAVVRSVCGGVRWGRVAPARPLPSGVNGPGARHHRALVLTCLFAPTVWAASPISRALSRGCPGCINAL